MNDENNTGKLPELKSLVDGYQDIKAPPGFSERVNAHIQDTGHQHWWSDVLANIWSYPKLVAGVAVAFVALFSIFIIQGTIDNEPQPQLAQTEKPAKDPLSVETEQVAQEEESIKANRTLAKTTEYDEYSNLAVLSDISQWLDDGEEISTPDFTDIPELIDIDSLIDST